MVDFWDFLADDVAPKRGKMVDHLTPFWSDTGQISH